MDNNKREIMKNIDLESKIGIMKSHLFYIIMIPLIIVFFIPILISWYHSILNLNLILISILIIGSVYLLFSDVEMGTKGIDLITTYIKYVKKGDRLYERFEFKKEE